jgi:hypothetical protein
MNETELKEDYLKFNEDIKININKNKEYINTATEELIKLYQELEILIQEQKDKEVSDNSIINTLLEKIKNNEENLKDIIMINNTINESQLKEVLKSLLNNSTVSLLDFRNNKELKGENFYEELCNLLENNKVIEDINFDGCPIEGKYLYLLKKLILKKF